MVHAWQWPAPTVHAAWAHQEVAQHQFFLRHPGEAGLPVFSEWVFERVRMRDLPSIGLALHIATESLAFPGARAGRRQGTRDVATTLLLAASGVVRLREAAAAHTPPRWARGPLRALSPQARAGLLSTDSEWVEQVFGDIMSDERGGSYVYVLGCHSGWYVGKANVRRAEGRGLACRGREHLIGTLLPGS